MHSLKLIVLQVERIVQEAEGLSDVAKSNIRSTAKQVADEAAARGPELAALVEEQGASAGAHTAAAADSAATAIQEAADRVRLEHEIVCRAASYVRVDHRGIGSFCRV